jgi:lysophospholipase L1-like esterase
VFYRLAAQTSGAVWDQFEIMGGLKSMYKWMQAGLAKKDRVHFTNAGYNLMGDLFFNAWLDAKRKVNLENKDVLLINE